MLKQKRHHPDDTFQRRWYFILLTSPGKLLFVHMNSIKMQTGVKLSLDLSVLFDLSVLYDLLNLCCTEL